MAEVEEGTEKKSSKMMFIIIALVVLLAGGGGAYYLMFMGEPAVEGEESKDEETAEEEEVVDTDTDLTYFDMKEPFIVNFPKSTGIRLLQVSVALLVEGEAAVEVLQKNDPMIRNNLLMLLSGQVPSELNTAEGKDALRKAINEEMGEIMDKVNNGKNRVQDVFFTSFVMQ